MVKKIALILICFLMVSSASSALAAVAERYAIRLTFESKEQFKTALKEVQSDQLDLAGVNWKKLEIELIVDEQQLVEVQADYPVTIMRRPGDSQKVDPEYLQPHEMIALITQMAADYPDITQLITIGDTEEGRAIHAIKISDNADVDEDELTILYNGQHHAREVMSGEVTTDIADYLLTHYGTDPLVTYWVDNYEIWIVPQVNLDGVEYVFTNNDDWRKDRHDPPPGSSYYGIDPNRNYPAFWGACNGSSGSPSDLTYRGQFPGESYCVSHMMNFIQTIKPVFDISYHSYSELVIYPYGCDGDYTPDHEALASIGQGIAGVIECDDGSMGYAPGTCWQLLYSADGGDTDWLYSELGSFSYVVELNASSSGGFLPDYDTWRDSTVERNRAGWQYLLNRLNGPLITGNIYDACTGMPIEGAEYGLEEIPLGSDETVRTTDSFGRYWRPVLPGDYTVVATASGYGQTEIPVTVGSNRLDQDIYLVPNGSFGVFPAGITILDQDGDDDGVLDPGETAHVMLSAASVGSTTSVMATISTSDPNVAILDAEALIGNIPDGSTGDTQTPHFLIQAAPGTPDEYVAEFSVVFSADQSLCAEQGTFSIKISSYVWQCPVYLETMDSDPGYTIDNSTGNGWEFGSPSAGPSSGYTGQYCYGTNLDGNHGNQATYKLTSTAFDCSSMSDTEVRFYRWLQNETNYDEAYVEVSKDNQNWTILWSGYQMDNDWTECVYDISSIADGEPTVYIRWRLESDYYLTEYGFYIDDVSICGKTAPETTPTPAPTWTPTECINDGDVNQSGEVTAGDAQMAFQIALGSYSPTYTEECAADCDSSGTVTAGDAQQIFLTALGTGTCVDML